MDRPTESAVSADPGAPPSPFRGRTAEAIGWAGHHIGRLGRGLWSRSGAPSVMLGSALLLSLALFGSDSPWALPVLIAGVGLLAAGILGPRLRINAGLRWEPEGIELSFNLGVDGHPDRERASLAATTDPPRSEPEVVEGRAETIELPAEAVIAALAAADAGSSPPAGADAAAPPPGTRRFAGMPADEATASKAAAS